MNSDKGVCSQNITSAFKLNGLLAMPFHGNRLVEGWQLSGIFTDSSGLPLNIADGYDEASRRHSGCPDAAPNYVSGCQVKW